MKKLSIFVAFLIFVSGITFSLEIRAQSDATKKALEEVRGSVSTLITVKDEENPMSIAFRIEAYKKVIDFSIAEAKDLRIKLFNLDDKKIGEDVVIWKVKNIEKLDSVIEYYESEKEIIKKNQGSITLEEIKEIAEAFKEKRENLYIPLVNEINDYFLIEQQNRALETTSQRTERVKSDIEKLKKTKIKTKDLEKLFSPVESMLGDAKKMNEKASSLFFEKYIGPLLIKDVVEILEEDGKNATSTTTSTIQNVEKKADAEELSIKDLVKDSFINVKDIYKIFIEMSNLVRKLL